MAVIKAKTMEEKINLFIKIADSNKDGSLNYQEIFELAKICLKKFVTEDMTSFLDDLCHYFTKLIFQAVGVDPTSDIPLKAIKKTILSGNQDSDLLCMFCGADI